MTRNVLLEYLLLEHLLLEHLLLEHLLLEYLLLEHLLLEHLLLEHLLLEYLLLEPRCCCCREHSCMYTSTCVPIVPWWLSGGQPSTAYNAPKLCPAARVPVLISDVVLAF